MTPERRFELREDELIKLKEMGVFQVVPRSTMPAGQGLLYPRWVDTPDKSRLTAADLKSKGPPTGLVHSLPDPRCKD